MAQPSTVDTKIKKSEANINHACKKLVLLEEVYVFHCLFTLPFQITSLRAEFLEL